MRQGFFTVVRGAISASVATALLAILLPTAAFAFNPFHPVTFWQNDSATDTVSTYLSLNSPADLTLFQNLSPSFVNPNHIFKDWNTAQDGSGVSYSDGELYSFASDLTLFAQWTSLYHPVSFEENANASDSVSAFESENRPEPLTPFTSIVPAFSKPGFSFDSWNTAADGSGTSYVDGATFSFADRFDALRTMDD